MFSLHIHNLAAIKVNISRTNDTNVKSDYSVEYIYHGAA